MKLFILIFTITSLMISCADILLEEKPITSSTSGIVGFWFTCEFDPPDVDCRFFDDDGVQFTNDGSVYRIETFVTSPNPDCGGWTCFDSFRPSITIYREFAGSYTYIDSSLIFNPESDTTCTEYFNWNSDVSFFSDSLSLCPSWGLSDLYFKKYRGDVVIN